MTRNKKEHVGASERCQALQCLVVATLSSVSDTLNQKLLRQKNTNNTTDNPAKRQRDNNTYLQQ